MAAWCSVRTLVCQVYKRLRDACEACAEVSGQGGVTVNAGTAGIRVRVACSVVKLQGRMANSHRALPDQPRGPSSVGVGERRDSGWFT